MVGIMSREDSPRAHLTSSESADYELLLFKSNEAYVYRVPPAGTAGHRAELWNVDKWITEVHVKIVRFSTDEACIRLSDPEAGELFAECPVSLPLKTCIEGVVDSSRYFVLRIVDRESGHHAFIGLGFRERNDASDFGAALFEHQQYLERKAAAAVMRKQFDDAYKNEQEREADGEQPAPRVVTPSVDYSLRPGEMLNLKIGSGLKSGSLVTSKGKLTKSFSLMFDPENQGAAVAALAPPPPAAHNKAMSRQLTNDGYKPMGISPTYRAVDGETSPGEAVWGEFESAKIEI